MKKSLLKFGCAIIFYIVAIKVFSQIPAFPGAEGFGAYTTGGRGGTVYEVTNLNDNGTGSLRAAITASGPRIVVFRVSGTIKLNSRLEIKNDNITIAGQTAPGDGICISNYPLYISANNVIIRYIRCRMGDLAQIADDAIGGRNRKNIIIDHCSLSWSVDETASFYDNENFTMQWCIISESLYRSVHDKGDHGYGGIWGGKKASFHKNLLAHHSSRNPRFCGSRYSNQPSLEIVDLRNNVIFNWGFNSGYGAEGGSYNIVNNYYKPGPATKSNVKTRIFSPNADDGSNSQPAGVWGTFYVSGNYMDGSTAVTNNNWDGIFPNPSTKNKDEIKSNTEFEKGNITTWTALQAYDSVLAYAGASIPYRDEIDSRIVNEVRTGITTYGGAYGTGLGIIDTQGTVGGWVKLNSAIPPVDTDHDGMPDYWEDANGLNKNNINDGKLIAANGYSNVENYLNSIISNKLYVKKPLDFKIDTVINNNVFLSWKDMSDNELGFIIKRSNNLNNEFQTVDTISENDTSFVDLNLNPGTYYYYIYSVAPNLQSCNSDTISVTIVANNVNITSNNNKTINMSIVPNTVKNEAFIIYNLDKTENVNIYINNITGKLLKKVNSGYQSAGFYTYRLECSDFADGLYFVTLSTNNSKIMKKFIIKR